MTPDEIRARNWKIVETYFAEFTDTRADLFTEDALAVYPFCGDTPDVPGTRGRERIRETFAHGMQVFRPMKYVDVRISSTQDPDLFWAEATSRGKQHRNGEVIDVYNKYVFYFRFEDGRIAEMREYYNPILAMKANHCAFEMPGFFYKAPEE
jgi:ketosteroid isomerase-like protein